jgi:hypothetical protein
MKHASTPITTDTAVNTTQLGRYQPCGAPAAAAALKWGLLLLGLPAAAALLPLLLLLREDPSSCSTVMFLVT